MLGPNDLCPVCFNTGFTKNMHGDKIPCSNDCRPRESVAKEPEIEPSRLWTEKPEKVETPEPEPVAPAAMGPAKEAISESITLAYDRLPVTYEIVPPARNATGTPFFIEEFWLWHPQLESMPLHLSIEANCINLFKGHAAVFLMGPIKLETVISTYSPIVITFTKAVDYHPSIPTMHCAVVMRGMYQQQQPISYPTLGQQWQHPWQYPCPQPYLGSGGQWPTQLGNGGSVTITGGNSGGYGNSGGCYR